jgi:tungstate transport system substrate-binding protein
MRTLALCLSLAGLVLCLASLPSPAANSLTLATTTSTQDSGLLEVLLPPFEKQYDVKLKVLAVGTGQALELGRRGDADVLMVHAPEQEEAFVKEGHGLERQPFMYNDFVLVGPAADPAHIRGMRYAADAFRAIAASNYLFASRGDESGTHSREKQIWREAKIEPSGDWYLSCGAGMAATLRIASEKRAYTLADRSTYLAWQSKLDLALLVEGDPLLRNIYSVIVVSPKLHPDTNIDMARKFAAYLFSDKARSIISTFGTDKFGQPLFHLLPEPAPAK